MMNFKSEFETHFRRQSYKIIQIVRSVDTTHYHVGAHDEGLDLIGIPHLVGGGQDPRK